MHPLAIVICAAIVLSAAVGVYLRERQIAFVDAHRAAPPADFSQRIGVDQHHRAADYTIASTQLSILETIYEALLAFVFLFILLPPLYGALASVIGEGLSRSVAIVVAFGACSAFVESPFSLARTFGLEARFGFNRTNLTSFFVDRVKAGALELLLGVPLLYAMFACLHAAPNTWWLFAYVGFLALMLLMTVIYPTLIAPLFNKFTPLPEGEMKRRLETLLARCGFEARGLYVIDASRRSTRGNAYFTGLGKAKRIVFFDTLLEKHSPDEIESILAHELGHFKFGHVRQMIALTAIMAFLGFAALGWAFGEGGLASVFGLPNDPGLVFVVAMLAKEPIMHLLTPMLTWRSRRAEFEADDFAKSMTGAAPMVSALTRLTCDNLATLTPDPLYAAFYYSHPPVPERVAHLRAA